jgi:hypothetical protein
MLGACTDKEQEAQSPFGQEIQYESVSTVHAVQFDNIYQPTRMRVFGDLLLISDGANEPPIHVLETKEDGSLAYLRGEGEIGRGPGEIQHANDFIKTDSLIYVYDGNQLKMVSYDVSFNQADNDDIQMKIQGRPVTMNALAGNKFVAGGLFFDDRFQVFSDQGELVGQYGKQINFNEDFTAQNLAVSWYSFSTADPSGEFVYLFALNADFIEKYDNEGNLIRKIQGKEFPVPKMKLEVSNDVPWPVDDGGKLSYLWVDADDEHIYALYIGMLNEDLDGLSADKVHVFDWDLNLVGAYQLDHRPNTIAADGDGGMYSFLTTDGGIEIRYQKLME